MPSPLALRRGFQIPLGEKILVVEDVVTKGGRVQETLDIVHEHGGQVVGVAMAVDRSGGTAEFGVPKFSLISLQVETFEPDQLAPDLAAIPATKPGSRVPSNFVSVAESPRLRSLPGVRRQDRNRVRRVIFTQAE